MVYPSTDPLRKEEVMTICVFWWQVFGYYYPSFGTFAYASASLFSIWNGEAPCYDISCVAS